MGGRSRFKEDDHLHSPYVEVTFPSHVLMEHNLLGTGTNLLQRPKSISKLYRKYWVLLVDSFINFEIEA